MNTNKAIVQMNATKVFKCEAFVKNHIQCVSTVKRSQKPEEQDISSGFGYFQILEWNGFQTRVSKQLVGTEQIRVTLN